MLPGTSTAVPAGSGQQHSSGATPKQIRKGKPNQTSFMIRNNNGNGGGVSGCAGSTGGVAVAGTNKTATVIKAKTSTDRGSRATAIAGVTGSTVATKGHESIPVGGLVDGIEIYLGLIGWRKKCLYTLLLLLMLLIITNLVLTLWILKVMEFTTVSIKRISYGMHSSIDATVYISLIVL